jgi:hypothetical protein
VELFREREKLVAQLAAELGISTSCLRRWSVASGSSSRTAS